jgi:hypothetical protein
MSRHREADLSKLKLRSIAERATRVDVGAFARPGDPAHARALLDELPRFLGANVLREAAAAVLASHRAAGRWSCCWARTSSRSASRRTWSR